MSTLQFVTQLISALAWPITVLVGVLLIRPFLVGLVPLIRSEKYSDVEIQFGREMAGIKATASTSLQAKSIEPQQQPIWEDLVRLAAVRPRTAISRAWQQVEGTLTARAKDCNLYVAFSVWQMPNGSRRNNAQQGQDLNGTVRFARQTQAAGRLIKARPG